MKKVLIIAFVAVLCFIAVGGYVLYVNMFPVAASLQCPGAEEITSVFLAHSQDPETAVAVSDVGILLEYIGEAQPTRIWSVQDYPTAESYYILELDTPERTHRYYVYEENAAVYLESPYEGVYEVAPHLLDFLEGAYRD